MAQASTAERFCINCNADRQVHIETGRCQTCGQATARGDALPVNGVSLPSDAAPRSSEKLVLPETSGLRRWVSQTQALAEGFKTSAAKASDRAHASEQEASRLARAARAFAGLLSQIGIEAPPPKQPRGSLSLPPGRWSREHEACLKCGTTERKHKASGFCTRCWRSKPSSGGSDAS